MRSNKLFIIALTGLLASSVTFCSNEKKTKNLYLSPKDHTTLDCVEKNLAICIENLKAKKITPGDLDTFAHSKISGVIKHLGTIRTFALDPIVIEKLEPKKTILDTILGNKHATSRLIDALAAHHMVVRSSDCSTKPRVYEKPSTNPLIRPTHEDD